MDINLELKSDFQRDIVFATHRYICGSGGYGNGKTYAGCIKALMLLGTFPRYRIAFIRKTYKVLRETTMRTFFKLCPPSFISSHSETNGYTKFRNGSEIIWLNLDKFDEQALKSLEINTAIIDQAEEIDESIFHHLDARVGRWDVAVVPAELLKDNPNWPINPSTKIPKVPAYLVVLCNPDTEFHWLYRYFHPESTEWKARYHKDYIMFNAASTDNPALDKEIIDVMMRNDPEWVNRYVKGLWGVSSATIHAMTVQSILPSNQSLLKLLHERAMLYRILDHGESSPTCVLWGAAFNKQLFIYREYYQPNRLISHHRKAIEELSQGENYVGNFADPSIFDKTSQKKGGRWSVADEYLDSSLCDAAPVAWNPADNNEFHTRNRISELLQPSAKLTHPITKESPAPALYFIEKSPDYPQGCDNVITETKSQRREKIGEVEGRAIYSDDRAKGIPDHAYDCLRYFTAIHARHLDKIVAKIPQNSFMGWRKKFKQMAYV